MPQGDHANSRLGILRPVSCYGYISQSEDHAKTSNKNETVGSVFKFVGLIDKKEKKKRKEKKEEKNLSAGLAESQSSSESIMVCHKMIHISEGTAGSHIDSSGKKWLVNKSTKPFCYMNRFESTLPFWRVKSLYWQTPRLGSEKEKEKWQRIFSFSQGL